MRMTWTWTAPVACCCRRCCASFADLDKNVVLVGQGSKVELWNEARWEAQVAQALTFSDDVLPPELEGFTL